MTNTTNRQLSLTPGTEQGFAISWASWSHLNQSLIQQLRGGRLSFPVLTRNNRRTETLRMSPWVPFPVPVTFWPRIRSEISKCNLKGFSHIRRGTLSHKVSSLNAAETTSPGIQPLCTQRFSFTYYKLLTPEVPLKLLDRQGLLLLIGCSPSCLSLRLPL